MLNWRVIRKMALLTLAGLGVGGVSIAVAIYGAWPLAVFLFAKWSGWCCTSWVSGQVAYVDAAFYGTALAIMVGETYVGWYRSEVKKKRR